ncbi:MAG: hypothetical protein P4L43_11430 [Syntrophobacteraceae bacterium]|nr:hypothetical protein [Syntrophobacteraceae bacterium]
MHLRIRYTLFVVAAVLLSNVVFAGPMDSFSSPVKEHVRGKGWSTANINGVWWLIDPQGKPFYSKGVDIVAPGLQCEKSMAGHAFFWANFYSSIDTWRGDVGHQLKKWGFNTLGGWSDNSPKIGLPLMVDLELGRNSQFHWFDPFDPKMEKVTLQRARELTAPYRKLPQLIGYFSDNEIGWWNSALFIWYLKDPWENHTKRFLWKMIYDTYGGDWKALLADWAPQGGAKSFDDLKEVGAALKLRPGGNGIRLVDRFMSAVAARYYKLMYRAIHAADPSALVLGDRLPLYYHQDVIRAMGDNVDAISTNYNVDTADGWVAPYYFDGLRKLDNKPVLISEFFFSAAQNRSGNLNEDTGSAYPNPGHLMTVPTQAERAWGAGRALVNFARFPNIAGAQWFQYCDEPLGGRADGENYDMGLIDTSNRPYELLTEQLRKLNPELDRIHEKSLDNEAKRSGGAGPVFVNEANYRIDVRDSSLVEWDKEKTLLSGFVAPAPHVPFADVHLTWKPEGFYLCSLSDVYLNPDFLACGDEFPKSEAFQLHFTVESGGAKKQLAIYLVPRKNPSSPDGFDIAPELFVVENGVCVQKLPTEGHLQRIKESLPHIAIEAFFPAKWFGVDTLKSGMRFKANIGVMSYFREFTMAWAGNPRQGAISEPGDFREIVLK